MFGEVQLRNPGLLLVVPDANGSGQFAWIAQSHCLAYCSTFSPIID